MSAIRRFRDIHTEPADLNHEAAGLAAKIQENFEEIGTSSGRARQERNSRY
jgi:hypothetical protein